MSQAERNFYTLTERMATLEAKEKDLRTITMDGFAEMRTKFQWVEDGFARMDKEFQLVHKKFAQHEEQIDFLAVELVNRTDRLEKKFDAMAAKIDLIYKALAI